MIFVKIGILTKNQHDIVMDCKLIQKLWLPLAKLKCFCDKIFYENIVDNGIK